MNEQLEQQIPVFGPVETIAVRELAVGDFVVSFPPQQGVAGVRVDSGVRDIRPDWGTWTKSSGYRRPRLAMESRVIMFQDTKRWRGAGVNYPVEFIVEVRRPQAATS